MTDREKHNPTRRSTRESACPVCGYEGLSSPPWPGPRGSGEVCPSCGIQFGWDDVSGGDPQGRAEIYERWREDWIRNGMQWFSPSRRPPARWDPHRQLRDLDA